MGFGFLFIGYIFFLYPFDPIFSGMSALFFFLGLYKLRAYNRGFRQAYYLNLPILAGGIAYFIVFMVTNEGEAELPRQIMACALYVLLLFFHASVSLGIGEMAREVGLGRLAVFAYRNMVVLSVYYAARAFFEFDFSFSEVWLLRIALTFIFLGLLAAVLQLVMVFRAYAGITLPEKNK